jgi:tetratricopeptide (TPR) repeat protein
MLQEICRDFPNCVDYRFDLCETYARVDPRWPHSTEGESSIVEDRLRKALAIADELAEKYPNEPAYMASQARIHLQLASSLQHKARLESKQDRQALLTEAEQLNRSALAIQSSLAQGFPDVTSYVVGLAIVKDSLARLLIDRSEFDEARSLLESSISDLEKRITADPEQLPLRGFLFHNYMAYAMLLGKMGEGKLASDVFQRAHKMHGRVPQGKPRFGRGMRWGRKKDNGPRDPADGSSPRRQEQTSRKRD